MSSLKDRIAQRKTEEGLSCIEAFSIAEEMGVEPYKVREEADKSGIRILYCQLGLFGYHAFGGKRFIAPLNRVPERLAGALTEASRDGVVSCAETWRIADREGMPRPVVGSAVDVLGIQIGPCQLGCFGSPTFSEKHADPESNS